MRFRNFRIAWSVAWGLLAVLLCVLWVRSYWWEDVVYRITPITYVTKIVHRDKTITEITIIGSNCGRITFRRMNTAQVPQGWTYKVSPSVRLTTKRSWFWVTKRDFFFHAGVSHWFVITPVGVLAVAPWLRWPTRFSLRTLLLTTTLIASVLGLVVWASS
jgi:hypothetical protein